MTCIVGVVHKRDVWMGGDSAGVAGWSLTVRSDTKVFETGPFLMGFTTSFRMGQLLRYSLKPPEHPKGMDTLQFMSTLFIDAVRKCLGDGGFLTKDKGAEEGGTFLVGYRGRLFKVDSDFQVGEAADKFAAVGCGADVALGALFATRHLPPQARVSSALQAAERFSAGVRRPFVLHRNGRDSK